MKLASLFAGVGGFELGLERAGLGHTIWQCEIDPSARAVLERHWPGAVQHGDIREVRGEHVERPDILCGGFPCQDISIIGSQAGLTGARSGLWHEYDRLIGELAPTLVLIENVSALVSRGLDVVLGCLAARGYDALWFSLRASDVGAPHRRERLFVVGWLADTKRQRLEGQQQAGPAAGSAVGGARDSVANSHGDRQQREQAGRYDPGEQPRDDADRCHLGMGWPPRPNDSWSEWLERGGPAPAIDVRGYPRLNPAFVERLMGFNEGWTDGHSRKQRLHMLGNAIVPAAAEVVGHVALGVLQRMT